MPIRFSMELKSLIEAILFAAQNPLALREIKALITKPGDSEDSEATRAFKKVKESEIHEAILLLKKEYEEQGRSFRLQDVAGSFHLISLPEFAPWLRPLFAEQRTQRLSQPALETLAIIAYRQPITRGDIEGVRGVAVDGVMQTLLERGLVTITGRAEVPGRPMLYGTTRAFLETFGLSDVNELPAVEELRKINLNLPESSGAIAPEPELTEETTNAESSPAPQTN